MARLMTTLLEEDAKVVWTSDRPAAFEEIEEKDENCQFSRISIRASPSMVIHHDKANGCVLKQVTAYTFRQLRKNNESHLTHDLE